VLKSCADAAAVPGMTFPMGRSDDGTDACPPDMLVELSCMANEQPEHDAAVAGFHLDTFEVTVGRFRQFAHQYDGTPPQPGSGAHSLIPGSGWRPEWNDRLPATQAELIDSLACTPNDLHTWTDTPGTNETYPICCVSWHLAFAFCAWSGRRLPTEAEWEAAAAGGDENRLYPWGQAEPDPLRANFAGSEASPFVSVGSHPSGKGRWGHHDLAGSMWEWVLDDFSMYDGELCDNCATLGPNEPVNRGGGWAWSKASHLRATARFKSPPYRAANVGFRCASSP